MPNRNQTIETALKLYRDYYYAQNKASIPNEQVVAIVDAMLGKAKRDINSRTNLVLSELARVSSIHLCYKDGGGKTIPYPIYQEYTQKTQTVIRVRELSEIADESQLITNAKGKQYHELEDLDLFAYLAYIEDRPGAEKEAGHGLFGFSGDEKTGNLSIDETRAMAEHQDSTAWAHIISLNSDTAFAAGYGNRTAWKDLIIAKAPEFARAYNISLENLVLNCAFHSNTDNPHVHLILYSTDKRAGFVTGGKSSMRRASERVKSVLYNEIFKEDILTAKQEKSALRDELKAELATRLEHCMAKDFTNPALEQRLYALAGLEPAAADTQKVAHAFAQVRNFFHDGLASFPTLGQSLARVNRCCACGTNLAICRPSSTSTFFFRQQEAQAYGLCLRFLLWGSWKRGTTVPRRRLSGRHAKSR